MIAWQIRSAVLLTFVLYQYQYVSRWLVILATVSTRSPSQRICFLLHSPHNNTIESKLLFLFFVAEQLHNPSYLRPSVCLVFTIFVVFPCFPLYLSGFVLFRTAFLSSLFLFICRSKLLLPFFASASTATSVSDGIYPSLYYCVVSFLFPLSSRVVSFRSASSCPFHSRSFFGRGINTLFNSITPLSQAGHLDVCYNNCHRDYSDND